MLALTIGCGDSSKKKSNCDGPCADAIRDASGDGKKDGYSDVMLPTDTRPTPDTLPTQPDTLPPTDAVPADVFVPSPDTTPVTPDAGDASVPDTRLPDTLPPDTAVTPDTIPVQPDTAIPDAGIDAPVNLDTAVDADIDAPNGDAALEVGDAFDDAGDASDAEIDA